MTEYCRVLQGIAGYCRVLQGIIEYYGVLQSIAEYHRVLQSVTEFLTHLLGPKLELRTTIGLLANLPCISKGRDHEL